LDISHFQFGNFYLPNFHFSTFSTGYLLLSKFALELIAEHSSVVILGPKGSRGALQTQDNIISEYYQWFAHVHVGG
jgi:hypothetical protein